MSSRTSSGTISDLEGQAVVSSEMASGRQKRPAGQELPTEDIGVSMNPLKVKMWTEMFGVRPIMPSAPFHPHPFLAAQRNVLEREAISMLLGNEGTVIVDVGSNPARTYPMLANRGRYMRPNIHLGDVSRRRYQLDPSLCCEHKLEECACYDNVNRAYLFTHSAYYIDPLALWHVLQRAGVVDAVSVEHVFDDIYGGFYGEATWSLEGTTVRMEVAGNGQPYIHGLPPWRCGWVGENGESFGFDVLSNRDNVTQLVRIIPTRGVTLNRELTWGEVEANPLIAGPVQYTASAKAGVLDTARFTGVSFDIIRLEKFGPFLFVATRHGEEVVNVTVPTTAISQVATHVLNRPRDALLYAEATHMIKNRFTRSRIPAHRLAQTLSVVVALGFVINLENEVHLTHTMLDKFSGLFTVHSALMAFTKHRPWTTRILTGFALMNLVWLIPTEIVGDPAVRFYALTAYVVAVIVVLVAWQCFLCVHRRWRHDRLGMWSRAIESDDSPTSPLLPSNLAVPLRYPIQGSNYIRPIPAETQGSMTLLSSKQRTTEPQRSVVSGVLLAGAIPTVLANTQEAEASGVANRILATKSNPEPSAIAKLWRTFVELEDAFNGFRVSNTRTKFDEWMKSIRKKYPQQYCQNLQQAYDRVVGYSGRKNGKPFLKIEKSATTISIDGGKATKPRMIQPPSDEAKAMTGYVINQIYRHACKVWDGIHSKVLYASGRTMRQVGVVVDEYLLRVPDAVGWSVDMSTYDATLGIEIQAPVFQFYERLGANTDLKKWLMETRTQGITANGVSFRPERSYTFNKRDEAIDHVMQLKELGMKSSPIFEEDGKFVVVCEDFQMASGRADTNLTDTVILVASMLTVLNQHDVDYLLLACGDDGFLLLPPDQVAIVEEIKEYQVSLGLKPEGKVSANRSDWEFCSKLFWYGSTGNGDKFTVLGSKPMRGIARMGINTTLPGAANAAAAALDIRTNQRHVPFLSTFAEATYQLCAKQKIRATGKMEWSAIVGGGAFYCHPDNYLMTQERYNLDQGHEEQFRKDLAQLTTVPCIIENESIRSALGRDEE